MQSILKSTGTIALTLIAGALLIAAPVAQHQAVNPPGTPRGLPFSNGIRAGNTLYVAGTQSNARGDIQEETRGALENIKKIVQAAGFSMADVVSVNVYLADVHDFAAMNDVYKTFFPDPKPTRTTVQVAGLVNSARIEISAIAVLRGPRYSLIEHKSGPR